jgi:hypothetical protein
MSLKRRVEQLESPRGRTLKELFGLGLARYEVFERDDGVSYADAPMVIVIVTGAPPSEYLTYRAGSSR